jgi:3-hydroxyisobutyryl-CoA hydrolase
VKTVIVDKIETRPLWSPASLYNVSAEVVANFFEPKSPYLTLAPELTIPADLTSGTKVMNPKKYALPSEEDIGSVITGSQTYGRMFGIQIEELLGRFNEVQPEKLGVKEKIYEVVQRKCEMTDNADGNRVWLKWKH